MPSLESNVLTDVHRPALAAFFDRHPDTTLFLRGNLALAGLGDAGHPFGGIWVGVGDADELFAVAAHFNGGNVVVAGGEGAVEAACHAVRESGREVKGVIGPWSLAMDALEGLDLEADPAIRSREVLYRLPLDALSVPAALAREEVCCRLAAEADLPLMIDWRMAFNRESLVGLDEATRAAAVHQSVHHAMRLGRLFVLEDARGRPLGTTAFNAWADGIVQVGGVFTPPEARGRGVARAAVAGSLLHAAGHGAHRSVLFTGEGNLPARRAYEALGYEAIGDYGLLLF
jgi:RimJ/RimL family protein N-acetyltransferase